MRNNSDRLSQNTQEPQTVASPGQSFPSNTTYVALPSGGRYYSEKNPLFGKDSLEFKDLTTKEEDILTNQSYIKNGVVFDKLLSSILIDKIDSSDLLPGDRDAVLIAARLNGYGHEHNVQVACPKCNSPQQHTIDISQFKNSDGTQNLAKWDVQTTEQNTFVVTLKQSDVEVEFKLLTVKDLNELEKSQTLREQRELPSNQRTEQMCKMIVSVNGDSDRQKVIQSVANFKPYDSRFLNRIHQEISPSVDRTVSFECKKADCQHIWTAEVPVTANFFWFV